MSHDRMLLLGLALWFSAAVVVVVVTLAWRRAHALRPSDLKNAAPGRAMILEMTSTSYDSGDGRKYTLLLRVEPSQGPAFQARVFRKVLVSETARFQPGAMLEVVYDPRKPRRVAIVEG